MEKIETILPVHSAARDASADGATWYYSRREQRYFPEESRSHSSPKPLAGPLTGKRSREHTRAYLIPV